jgi:16S rRNA (cytidine1402-2'-O)-methyltransferase
LSPGLYLVGTPIGNLDDLSPRAVRTLREADAILTEDTRRTRILLDRFGIRTPMMSCHKFNEAARVEAVLGRIRDGAALALVSESGMPAVSDPGARLVAACGRQGLPVTAVPGPSAVTAAVALSGFPCGGFVFEGFLPRTPAARRRRLEAVLAARVPVVVFESPHRLVRLLEDLRDRAPDRQVMVGRELTKAFEECVRGTAGEVLARFGGRGVKGEVVLVVAPAVDRSGGECYPRSGPRMRQ